MPPDPASPDGRSIAIRSGLLGRSVSIHDWKSEYPRYEAARPLARALRSRRRMIGRSEDLLWECRAADSGVRPARGRSLQGRARRGRGGLAGAGAESLAES